jgi:hypothetical protein
MTTILDRLAELDVYATADGAGGLVLEGPEHALTPELLAEVRASKPALLAILRPAVADAFGNTDRAAAAVISPCGAVSVSLSAAGVFVELASERILHADHLADLPEGERAAVVALVRSGTLWQCPEVVLPLRRRWAGQLRERALSLDPAAAAGFIQAAELLEPAVDHDLTT